MFNENMSSIEYYFEKLREKIILISLIKNKDIFSILVKLISDVLPNTTKNDQEINQHINDNLKNNEKIENTKEKIKKVLFLFDEKKQAPGKTNHLNRESVTYNIFHFFNKEIFDNRINKNVEIQFVNDDSILSTHDVNINTFEKPTIYINNNVFSVLVLSNVLLKEMAEIYYFYNENRIAKENKLYLKNNFRSLYLPYIFKYAKGCITSQSTNSSFHFGESHKDPNNNQQVHINTISEDKKTVPTEKDKVFINSINGVNKENLSDSDSQLKEQLHMEKNQYDINTLINRIAYCDHDEIFKEILHFRKMKYNDNSDIQKCLEEYLLTYDKINMSKYCSVENEEENEKMKKEVKEEKDKECQEQAGVKENIKQNSDSNITSSSTSNVTSSVTSSSKETTNDSYARELYYEPSDIRHIYLNKMYQYIEHVIEKKEFPISFNRINEYWINALTDLEHQKIVNYSTTNYTGHLYNLLVNSKACSPKRALDILHISLTNRTTDPKELTEETDSLKESTVSSSELNDSVKNFDEFVIWISKNKRKNLEKIDPQLALRNAPENFKDDVKEVINQHNHAAETGANMIENNVDVNNITIDDIKDLIKKHNISKDDLTTALNQLQLGDDVDVDSLYESCND